MFCPFQKKRKKPKKPITNGATPHSNGGGVQTSNTQIPNGYTHLPPEDYPIYTPTFSHNEHHSQNGYHSQTNNGYGSNSGYQVDPEIDYNVVGPHMTTSGTNMRQRPYVVFTATEYKQGSTRL